jgi:hypothetical protein
MKKYKIAVLDDCQNVALESADWSVLRDRADIVVFQDHLADPNAVIHDCFDIGAYHVRTEAIGAAERLAASRD